MCKPQRRLARSLPAYRTALRLPHSEGNSDQDSGDRALRRDLPILVQFGEFSYHTNFAVTWRTRGLLLNVFVGLLNSGLLAVT